jgi:osmoprotectant transport system ATP-binding protein
VAGLQGRRPLKTAMPPDDPSGPVIALRHVTCRVAGGRALVEDLDLEVRRGETLVLLGRSGSGKTTTLKLINRLLEPSDGEVWIRGRPARDWDPIRLRRGIGWVIQETGLLPHLSVQDNVGLVPRLLGWPRDRVRARAREMLELVGLNPDRFAGRAPRALSGGQRQRVGVARALAADPSILLMDEPFGALDPLTRAELQREFRGLRRRLGTTVVFVTHDVREALLLGSRVALLQEGRLAAVQEPRDFLRAPAPAAAPFVRVLRDLDAALAAPPEH